MQFIARNLYEIRYFYCTIKCDSLALDWTSSKLVLRQEDLGGGEGILKDKRSADTGGSYPPE